VVKVLEDFEFNGIAPHDAQFTGSGNAEPAVGRWWLAAGRLAKVA
jgi:hypothetical protein